MTTSYENGEADSDTFGPGLELARDKLVASVLKSAISGDIASLSKEVAAFADCMFYNGYRNGFAIAIVERRGEPTFDSMVDEIEGDEPDIRNNPDWVSGLEQHDEVYRRGALAGFRLALKDDMTDPEYVKTKQFIQQLDSLEKQN